jgi:hypothetical protein
MSDKEIEKAFQDAWKEFGDDCSTEFLLSITADRCKIEYDQVVTALANIHDKDLPNE